VDKIPEVIEALAKEAFNTTKRIQEKTKEVRELAAAISSLMIETKAKSVRPAEQIVSGQESLTATGKLSDMLSRDAKEGSK
jgi:hypothetical protein